MDILINDKRKLLAHLGTEKITSKATAAFAKFGHRVRQIVIHVSDANGPKGGVDKQCNVVVKLRKLNGVAVSVKDESLSKAISAGIRRAARSVNRQIERRTSRNGFGPASNFKFAHSR